jgi:hypothetical protein
MLAVSVVGSPPCVADGFESHAVGALLACELATRPRGLRPAELIAALNAVAADEDGGIRTGGERGPGPGGLELGHARRLHQWIERDGARREPLPVCATDAPHAEERAS